MMEFFKKKITKDQCRDTGMAMVLLLLLLSAAPKRHGFLIGAIVLHVVNMIVPQIYRPVAVVWLGLSNLLGEIVPKVLLSIVFFLVVTPIGMLFVTPTGGGAGIPPAKQFPGPAVWRLWYPQAY